MAIDKITTPAIADDAVTNAKVSYNNNSFRNIIINGDMSIAQRATSATGLTNGSTGYHTVDRFQFAESGSPSAAFTQTQSSDVPTGQGFATSLKMDCTTAQGSLAAGDLIRIRTTFEGQNLQYLKKGTSSAESLTMSFWVKSSKTGTYICQLLDKDNSRSISKSYTISSADTWEKKTITYDGDTTGAFTDDNGSSLQCIWWLGAGSGSSSGTLQTSWGATTTADTAVGQVNFADSTSNDWYITGVQLEAGTSASDFEFLPVDVNLQRCQRYCFAVPYSSGDAYHGILQGFFPNTTLFIGDMPFPTNMRAEPSLTTSGSFGLHGTSDFSASSFTLTNPTVENIHSVEFRCTTSGVTAGQGARFRNQNDASAKFILSSEL